MADSSEGCLLGLLESSLFSHMAKWDREEVKVGRRSGSLFLKSPLFVCVYSPVCVPMWDPV